MLTSRQQRAKDTLFQRFYSKVNKDGPIPAHRPDLGNCWVWTPPVDGWGYGFIGIERRKVQATHVALQLDGRPLAPGMWALHHCDNPPCVRPTHLYPGTAADNSRDRADRGHTANQFTRNPLTHCYRGHPYAGPNLYVEPSGKRVCRTCRALRDKHRRDPHRLAARGQQ